MGTVTPSSTPSLEVWAGIECTVNRVGDRYFDQLRRSGHHDRIEDLDRIASLGFSRMRYPVLWERTLAEADWAWPRTRLACLRALGIAPIVTLLHHGSGPPFTSLVDPAFPERFAGYARAVATMFPWVDAYTPINEPLTTARFSGLYGHWYPHGTDDATFVRALVNECKASILAMREIRAVTPHARFIHTEDLGYTHATPRLAYQARLENERRWLSIDLLCGRVERDHPLYRYVEAQVGEHELAWLVANALPPDVLGFNYYLTSERFLDEDLARWPAWSHGGNDLDRYADVHSVLAGKLVGIDGLLADAHARFGIPVAATEIHIGGTRDDQLRWLVDIVERIYRARARGVPIVAITAWSTFGAFDWHCLVTRCEQFYEPGLFDVRSTPPRPTALAAAWRAIARGERPRHPVLAGPGWWTRQEAA